MIAGWSYIQLTFIQNLLMKVNFLKICTTLYFKNSVKLKTLKYLTLMDPISDKIQHLLQYKKIKFI